LSVLTVFLQLTLSVIFSL